MQKIKLKTRIQRYIFRVLYNRIRKYYTILFMQELARTKNNSLCWTVVVEFSDGTKSTATIDVTLRKIENEETNV